MESHVLVSVDWALIVCDGSEREVKFLLRFKDENGSEYVVSMDEGEARSKYESKVKEFEEEHELLLSTEKRVAEVGYVFLNFFRCMLSCWSASEFGFVSFVVCFFFFFCIFMI